MISVENLRGITGGPVGDVGSARKGLSPQSYGKHTATGPFCDSGAPGATADGAVVETKERRRDVTAGAAQSVKS